MLQALHVETISWSMDMNVAPLDDLHANSVHLLPYKRGCHTSTLAVARCYDRLVFRCSLNMAQPHRIGILEHSWRMPGHPVQFANILQTNNIDDIDF